jgi:hypothetical protein
MADIDDLVKSISDCEQEELLERIRIIRLSRRTTKAPPKSKRKGTTVKKKEISIEAILADPKMAQKLLDALREGDDET